MHHIDTFCSSLHSTSTGRIFSSAFPVLVHVMGCVASARATMRCSKVISFDEAVGTTEIIPSPNPLRSDQEVEHNPRTLESLKIAVAISTEDQVDFDDSELDVYGLLPRLCLPDALNMKSTACRSRASLPQPHGLPDSSKSLSTELEDRTKRSEMLETLFGTTDGITMDHAWRRRT